MPRSRRENPVAGSGGIGHLGRSAMQRQRKLILAVSSLLGAVVGMLAAYGLFWHQHSSVRMLIDYVPGAGPILQLPAVPLFYTCVFLGIGPSGDAGWAMYPWCIVASWTLLGFLVGLVVVWRRRRAVASTAGSARSS